MKSKPKKSDYDKIHDIYPWMPIEVHMYFKNQLIRAWASMTMKPISDKLWDTDDNKKRLELAKQIEKWSSDKKRITMISDHEARERRKEKKEYIASRLGHRVSVEMMRRGNGAHWNVVK